MRCIYRRAVLLLLPFYSFSQHSIQPLLSLWQPLYAYSTEQKNVYALQDNIASVVKMNSFQCGLYGERRFLIRELSFYNALVAAPTPHGNFSLNAAMFTFPQFSNMFVGLGYGKQLNKIADCGLQFSYQTVNIPGYTKRSALGAELGMIFHLSGELNTGISIKNINSHSIKKTDAIRYPWIYSAGIGYDASKQVYLGMEVRKVEGQPAETIVSLHYQIHKRMRLNISDLPSSMNGSLGAGLSLKDFELFVITNYHQLLGITPALFISYNKKKQ